MDDRIFIEPDISWNYLFFLLNFPKKLLKIITSLLSKLPKIKMRNIYIKIKKAINKINEKKFITTKDLISKSAPKEITAEKKTFKFFFLIGIIPVFLYT